MEPTVVLMKSAEVERVENVTVLPKNVLVVRLDRRTRSVGWRSPLAEVINNRLLLTGTSWS